MVESTRTDALVPRVADELGLRAIAPLTGGVFGAMLVADADGRELVLKALPSEEWASHFAHGASMAERLRVRGYPASHYVGTGVASGASWSLQERLPGEVPDWLTAAHARRLIELAEMHAGAAGENGDWEARTRTAARGWLDTVAAHDAARELGDELAAVIARDDDLELLSDGVMHCDFHPRNYLADGDEVKGVFDWELATAGDWRFDLLTLSFWSSIHRRGVEPEAREMLTSRLHEVCPPAELAFFAACQSLRQLDFDARTHPELLPALVEAIRTSIAPWWRAEGR